MASPCHTSAQGPQVLNVETLETTYQYRPIVSKDEIRVLRLEPGSFAEPLIGSLVVMKIGNAEEIPSAYSCVSYCWGPQQNFTSFLCDEKTLRITLVIDEMLRYLRKATKPRHVWIDAKKSRQVRSMGRIYASARKVHVWLGSATDEELDAVSPLFTVRDSNSGEIWNLLSEKYFKSANGVPTSTSMLLEKFFSRAWFTRRWVLQEVALGRSVVVHCGDRKVHWDWFHSTANLLWLAYDIAQSDHVFHDRAVAVMNILDNVLLMGSYKDRNLSKLEHYVNVYKGIFEILMACHTAICMDERDRIYSLYGILTKTTNYDERKIGSMLSCPVDYDIHFSQAFTTLASAGVEAGKSQEVLIHAITFGSLADQNESWPSWVPDWSIKRKMEDVGLCLEPLRRDIYQDRSDKYNDIWKYTTQGLWKEVHPKITHVDGKKALHLHGFVHRIDHTQSSTSHLDAASYFKSLLDLQSASQNSSMARDMVAWVMMLAIDFASILYVRTALDLASVVVPRYESLPKGWERERLLLNVATRFLRDPLFDGPQVAVEIDEDKFVSEARRLLEGLDAFCYEYEGTLTFGIAFAQVKPGDFVFRTTNAAEGNDKRTRIGGDRSPSVFGFIIRPYHPRISGCPVAYRLVGMCLDYYPDVKDTEIVEVIIV